MFKNLLLYRLSAEWQPDLADVDARLAAARFVECGATQPMSRGWVSPRGVDHAPLVESIQGQWLLTLMLEHKVVPGAVVRRKVDALARRIEQDTGRAPGKKTRRELKDQALLELLPQAFARQGQVRVWLHLDSRLLAVDAASPAKADEVLSALAEALPGFVAQRLDTARSPASAMADWLSSGEAPAPFTIDRDCELKAPDGEKPSVRYSRHTLDTDELRSHIAAGKQPTRLALSWRGRVSFVLTDAGQLKRLAFLDGVFEKLPGASRDEQFDTDAAISTGELLPLIDELAEALGGEAAGIGAAAPGATPPPAAAPRAPTVGTAPTSRPAAASVPPWEEAA